ncbi:molybdopterin converting factor subunit 1 [Amycolatopsis sp. cmx-4-61]|uniref:molybdopterin converting factor subunit 1 n=1 Tax=Amycolatopsis sp. cmx-4-61 TaxID=2790937 RepID=UPI00397C7635
MPGDKIAVNVLYFGLVRERCGNLRTEEVALDDGATVADLVEDVAGRHPRVAAYCNYVQLAVNESIAPRSTLLKHGDTVAFIPQVAGGSGPYYQVTDRPLDIGRVVAAVTGPAQGGVVVFVGNVRDHNDGHDVVSLHYEAYDSMALRTFQSIIERCEAIGQGVQVAIEHRVGELTIGDAAVVIAAAAPHRAEAFEAARTAIELLKAETPIWKKELTPTGAEWIGDRP